MTDKLIYTPLSDLDISEDVLRYRESFFMKEYRKLSGDKTSGKIPSSIPWNILISLNKNIFIRVPDDISDVDGVISFCKSMSQKKIFVLWRTSDLTLRDLLYILTQLPHIIFDVRYTNIRVSEWSLIDCYKDEFLRKNVFSKPALLFKTLGRIIFMHKNYNFDVFFDSNILNEAINYLFFAMQDVHDIFYLYCPAQYRFAVDTIDISNCIKEHFRNRALLKMMFNERHLSTSNFSKLPDDLYRKIEKKIR